MEGPGMDITKIVVSICCLYLVCCLYLLSLSGVLSLSDVLKHCESRYFHREFEEFCVMDYLIMNT